MTHDQITWVLTAAATVVGPYEVDHGRRGDCETEVGKKDD